MKKIKYKDYQKLIMKLAHEYCIPNHVGMEYNDLLSIGNELFMLTKKNYNKEKSSFATSLYHMLSKRFYWMRINAKKIKKNNFMAQALIIDKPSEIGYTNCIDLEKCMPISESIDIEKQFIFFESLSGLSQDSKHVIQLVLDMPMKFKDHIINSTGNGRVSKVRIQEYLIDEGWGIGRIWNSFAEIKNIL